MAVARIPQPDTSDLDEVVSEICLGLQISPTQFELARGHYEAVGEWLGGDGSPLADLAPRIYPQGSMALRTTVRPRQREEYDLDLVLEVPPSVANPMLLYEQVADRLAANKTYKPKLERMKRCLRLNYEHEFHLDILPARRDRERGSTCIEVPDTALEAWKSSNPLGYIMWFERKCAFDALLKAEREQAPLPPPMPESQARVLRQVVQLMKRRRDNVFKGADRAPRSVVLTTLSATFYAGEESLTRALHQALAAIATAVTRAHPRAIEVRNPTNQEELFSESWTNDPEAYRAFSASVLASLEMQFGVRLIDHFDLLVGTSTGGIIALALAAGVPASAIREFYRSAGPRIFAPLRGPLRLWRLVASIVRPKHSQAPLRAALPCRSRTRNLRGPVLPPRPFYERG